MSPDAPSQLALDLPHRTARGREDFLVAECNRAAVAWLDRWPDWPAPALAIHGPPGCGKTHLAHVWQARSGALPIEPAALVRDPAGLLAGQRAAALDLAGGLPPTAERALLHLYNLLAAAGGHLLICAPEAPARWGIGLADLRARLAAAPAVAEAAPDDRLIAAVLVKLFADRQLKVGTEVIAYLVPRMERSFAAAQATVAALDRAALARRCAVSVPLARALLAEGGAGEGGVL
jgi:chromosomal replication initiation ATPase DnaA